MAYFAYKERAPTITEKNEKFLYKPMANKKQNIINFFSKNMLKNEQLLDAEEGLYTWILRGDEKRNNLYAIRTISKQEIGTLHANLKLYTDATNNTPIMAAGELQLIREEKYVPPFVIFNLLSGTYMLKKFEKLSNSNKKGLTDYLSSIVADKLIGFGISSQFIGSMNIIEGAYIPTNENMLEELNKRFIREPIRSTGGRKTRRAKRSRKTRKARY
jgi:hypothetical protein